jgi:hypothetical protein
MVFMKKISRWPKLLIKISSLPKYFNTIETNNKKIINIEFHPNREEICNGGVTR